jgi:hypothetical protein
MLEYVEPEPAQKILLPDHEKRCDIRMVAYLSLHLSACIYTCDLQNIMRKADIVAARADSVDQFLQQFLQQLIHFGPLICSMLSFMGS